MKKTNNPLSIEIGAVAREGDDNKKHPYMRYNFKGSEEVQKLRKERGIIMSWDK